MSKNLRLVGLLLTLLLMASFALADDHEPDDVCSEAFAVSALPYTESAMYITPLGDHDWRKFSIASATSIKVETISDHPGTFEDDTDLGLWSACPNAGSLVAYNDDRETGISDFTSLIETGCLPAGDYFVEVGAPLDFFLADNFTLTIEDIGGATTCGGSNVTADIKFCSDVNAFNCKQNGVVPVTIFGSAGLDVSQIDLDTLMLCLSDLETCTTTPYGVQDWSIADRGSAADAGAGACIEDVGTLDGMDDLDVAFDAQDVAALIGCEDLEKGEASPSLVVLGELLDGTPFVSASPGSVGIDQLVKKNGS